MICKKEKIIIIGAGLSGLYAGFLLQEVGYNVLILEASDRVGGRTLTDNDVDLGGTWISSKHPRMLKLCKKFGLTLYRQYENGAHITYINKKRNEITGMTYKAKIADNEESISSYIDLFYALTDDEKFMDNKKKLDEISLYDWCLENVPNKTARKLICWSFNLLTCVDARHASMFFWLYFLKNCGGYHILAGIRDGAQEFKIIEGAQTVSKKLAEDLEVLYKSEVIKIEYKNDNYHIYTADHKIYLADKVISAIPMQLIPNIEWLPSLEPERIDFYKSSKMGKVTKLVCQYETPFWREQGYSGKIACDSPPISLCYDACQENHHAIVIFIVDDKGYAEEEILEQLAFLINNTLAKYPKKIYRKNWALEKFSGGCYFAIPEINSLSKNHQLLTKNKDKIYFVSTETAAHWMGYMEGALESAERVVSQINLE